MTITPVDTTIAIVDDDKPVRDAMAVLIEPSGYAIKTFDSGREFLNSAELTACGCAILDVRMPDMSGLDILEHIVSRGMSLPVIMVTGHGDVPMAVRAMKDGAVDFIEKPFRQEKILDSIERALAVLGSKTRDDVHAREVAERVSLLTPREREVFAVLVMGQPNKDIALELDISPRTVEVHRSRIMRKMKVGSQAELVRSVLIAKLDIGPVPSRG